MIRKYHNHKQQTNPQLREEEIQDIYSNKTSKRQYKQSNQLSLPRQRAASKSSRSNDMYPHYCRNDIFYQIWNATVRLLVHVTLL